VSAVNQAISRHRGFTLIEILVALAVLSIAALTALRASGNAVNNIHALKQQSFAHWLALNKSAELELASSAWEQGKMEGTELMANQRWYWRAAVHETPEPEMRRVELSVWPGDNEKGEPAARLTMLRRR